MSKFVILKKRKRKKRKPSTLASMGIMSVRWKKTKKKKSNGDFIMFLLILKNIFQMKNVHKNFYYY
uniref:Uncharacterized protein n=1 Tax=Octopus bimaculoides TaxID=37653 RepID=A0A0L8GTM8_OCTBM